MAGVGRMFKTQVSLKSWLPALQQQTKDNAIVALWNAGMQIKEVARLMAPRETGAMMNSIALVARHKSQYGGAVMAAGRFRPGVAVQTAPIPMKDEVYIVPVVGYAGHVEYGTMFSRQQAFLTPAVRAVGKRVLPKEFGAEIFGKYKSRPPLIKRWVF